MSTESESVKADRRWFVVSDEQLAELQRLLAQPARELPRLRALMADVSERVQCRECGDYFLVDADRQTVAEVCDLCEHGIRDFD